MARQWLLVVSLVLTVLPATPLAAQRSISLLALTGNAAGHARAEADPDRPAITPDHPVGWEVAAVQDQRAWRAALRLRHVQADLAIRGTSSAVLTRAAVRSWSLGVDAGRRLVGAPEVPTVHALLGVAVERATFPVTGGDPRTVVVALAALEGAVPLTARWRVVWRGEVGRSGALFGANELPPGYAVRAGRRWNLGVGLGWRP